MTSLERTAAEIIAGLLLLVGFILYERHQGAQACIQADAKAVTQQEAHNATKALTDAQTINTEARTYANTLAEPAPIDSPHVSLCHYTPSAVPKASSPGPVPDGTAYSRSQDTSPIRITVVDVGPPLVKIGVDSDSQVRALQDYVQRVCLVR